MPNPVTTTRLMQGLLMRFRPADHPPHAKRAPGRPLFSGSLAIRKAPAPRRVAALRDRSSIAGCGDGEAPGSEGSAVGAARNAACARSQRDLSAISALGVLFEELDGVAHGQDGLGRIVG